MATTKTFISSVGAKSQGRYSYYKMLSEARQGDLVKVKRGVYARTRWLTLTRSCQTVFFALFLHGVRMA